MRNSGPGTPSSRAVAAGFARLGAPTASPRNERAFMPLIETDAVQGVFEDTGNTELNSHYIQQIAGSDIGGRTVVFVYENDVTSDGHRVTNNIAKIGSAGNPNASIEHNYLIQLLEEHGVAVGGATPTYVVLDFESTFLYPWLEGYDTDENEETSRTRIIAALEAVKAHFGTGIRISMWGMPAIPYYEIVGKSASYRLTAIQDFVDRFIDIVRACDFVVPSTYEYWCDTATMDPAQRTHTVVADGGQAAALSGVAGFEAYWEEANLARQANVTCALECVRQAGMTIGVYPSYWAMFTPSSSLCIHADHEGQYIPIALAKKDLKTHINRPGVLGYHLWNPIRGFAGRAFTATGGTNEWRDGIVNRFYGGNSPVPGTYANWAVTQFRHDWAVLYNDMILELLRAVATVVR